MRIHLNSSKVWRLNNFQSKFLPLIHDRKIMRGYGYISLIIMFLGSIAIMTFWKWHRNGPQKVSHVYNSTSLGEFKHPIHYHKHIPYSRSHFALSTHHPYDNQKNGRKKKEEITYFHFIAILVSCSSPFVRCLCHNVEISFGSRYKQRRNTSRTGNATTRIKSNKHW